MLTTLTVQVMSVSVQYFVYELTHDPLMLGLIGLAEAVPAIGVALWAGHIADKYNRRNILLVCLLVLLGCCVGLVWISGRVGVMAAEGVLGLTYLVIFINGLARGFFSPTNFAFLPQLVGREYLPNAISWNSSAWEIASIGGLGLGGLLYGFWHGPGLAFGVMTFLCVAAVFAVLRIAPRPLPSMGVMEPAWVRIREGLRFVFSNQLIISSIVMDLLAVLFGGAVALLPIFSEDILHVGPEGLGILRAAMSVGAILMAFVIAHRPPGRRAGKLLLACVGGFGLCMIGFGLSTHFWLSFALLVVAGMLDEVSVFIRSSLVQHLTPEHLKGRVSSVSSIFITSSNEIGAFESGLMARLVGTVSSVVLGGCITLTVVAGTYFRAPKLRQLDFSTFHRHR